MAWNNISMGDYVFVDGAYLRESFKACMTRYYGTPPKMDLRDLQKAFDPVGTGSTKIAKLFYYDCVDDAAKANETPEQTQARVAEQEEFLRSIRTMPGWHVREGRLAGSRRGRTQKRVDVLLAVELMSHSLAKNMSKAILIAGDDDFTPLVSEIIRHGTYIQVWSEKSSAAPYLADSADESRVIDFWFLWTLASEEFKSRNLQPSRLYQASLPDRAKPIRQGRFADGKFVQLRHFNNKYYFAANFGNGFQAMILADSPDLAVRLVEDHVEKNLLPIEWRP